jgi:transcriptional regulator with XRE-family HTH domain
LINPAAPDSPCAGWSCSRRGRAFSTIDLVTNRYIFAARLREAREYIGFSQDQVASFLGVSRSALSNMETGQRKVEALELKKLAGLYKRTISHFTDEEGKELTFDADVAHLARKVSELSPDDRAELARFAEFLQAK